ncbi:MAG TPA: DUF6542 domain-containing protein [Mycobacteriales bacterium]|nr:DUF6542 domain-containing protein [Mycobacteriales bacterium]
MYVDQVQRRDEAPAGGGPALTGIGAVLLLAGIAAVAGVLDVLAGSSLRLIFACGLVLGAVVAAVLVRRRDLLMVVFAPPLVFVAASAVAVLLGRGESGGTLIDLATSWLVFGFPAMAIATGAAAVVWLVRRSRR